MPHSVAILGVSSSGGSLGGNVLENLKRFNFAGDIHLVHPKAHAIEGRPCIASIDNLPKNVDCVVLAIPSRGILDAVRSCVSRGVGGVVIFSAGFAELGAEGRTVQDEIGRVAKEAGMALMGPNCLGFINYADGIPLSFSATEPHPPAAPGIAIVSQSGAMAAVIRAALHARDLDISLSVSTGNEAANGIEDYLGYILEQEHTRVLTLVVEHFRSPAQFLRIADRARKLGKPIVLLHPGRSAEARRAAETHTGALTGDYVVMKSIVSQRGVIVVCTMEELVDVSECLMRMQHLPRQGAAILGESGAFKALMLDYCQDLSLALPQPEGEAAAVLSAIAPGLILPTNPMDLTAQILVQPEIYRECIGPLMETPGVGSVMVSVILSSEQMAHKKLPPVLEILSEFAKQHAVVFAMLGEDTEIGADWPERIRAMGVPFFRSPERALRAIKLISRWQDQQAVWTMEAESTSCVPTGPLAPGIVPEYRAKALFAEAGMPVGRSALAQTMAEAITAANEIGYPVVLKAQSALLSHKSDSGGVALNIANSQALGVAWDQMQMALAKAAPDITLDGILVEPMVGRGLELILGAQRDPEWGPVMVVGLGGVMTEALQDVRHLPVGLPRAFILAELFALKGKIMLGPFRGEKARDLGAVCDCIQALGRFLQEHPEVTEVDINPLLVFEDGKGAAILDALIRVG
tara:strand:- start:16258 stop:18333 length:2076 start_codon:yes stop_codon:yes gene_type:complete